jgi:hypothetical protein
LTPVTTSTSKLRLRQVLSTWDWVDDAPST